MNGVLDQIGAVRATLSPAERKVADQVQDHAGELLSANISAIARRAGVSDPTVLRFCRSLGYQGFQEFKLALAGSLASPTYATSTFSEYRIADTDPMTTVAGKVVEASQGAFAALLEQLDPDVLEEAVTALARARRVEFYGLGASATVAADAHHKFFRLNMTCIAYSDSHMQAMSAATLTGEDVVLAVSKTGRTVELVNNATVARRQGATVIALTQPESPLAAAASQVIGVDLPEDTDFVTPMTSRLAHLAVIDMLAAAVAARRPGAEARLGEIKQALRARRVTPETALDDPGRAGGEDG